MDDEAERTLYCGNLDNRVTEDILYELFLQAGPLQKVKLPEGKPYGFVTFQHPVSVQYTLKLMDGIRLFGKGVRLQRRTGAGTPARQNSSGGNLNMMQNGMMSNMSPPMMGSPAMMGHPGNMSPAVMALPGLMGQSPFQRSYSAPQFQSTPNAHHQRFPEGSEQGNRGGRNDTQQDFRDRQRERDRNNRDHSRDRERERDRSFDRDRDHGRDREHSRDRDYGQNRDYGRDRGQNRGYGRDRGKDRDWDRDNNRDRNQDRGNNFGGLNRRDTFPLMQGQQHHQQGQLTRQSGFDQDPMAASIDNELRRQRQNMFQQQNQFSPQNQFQQQLNEARKQSFGRTPHQGQGRYRRH